MMALCKNPKTPQNISLSILKSLRIFDMADLTRNQQIPVAVRIRAEMDILERILTLPLGIKITLARRAGSAVLVKLLQDGMKEVSAVCLDSPILTEGDICRIISMKKTSSQVIRQIAEHPKWSRRYDVRWALIRNNHAPLAIVVEFLENIKTTDLKELYEAPEVPSSTKPFLYRELLDRGQEP
jgi:predicted aconitase with swiveling domain